MPSQIDDLDWPQSIRGINELDRETKDLIYLTLVPEEVFSRFGISKANKDCVRINCPPDTRSFEIVIYEKADSRDPIIYLQMADTLNFQIAVLLFVINDVSSERFNVDVDSNGLPTRFGTQRRNVGEELRAMKAGLAPGQVYRGLRVSQRALPLFETFIRRTGHDSVIIEPLTYNNALMYERYGFTYYQGRRRMEWINSALRPGGALFDRFIEDNPFRIPQQWNSIRSRAWAIHDGILDEPFGDIRMYKRIGHNAGINTFPDGIW